MNRPSWAPTFVFVPPALSINDVTANEGQAGTTSFTFTVTRTGNLSRTASVSYATANNSATAGSDYTAANGTLNFAATEATKSITVLVAGDTAIEGNETFFVNLSGEVNATISDTQGIGTITNDDFNTAPVANNQNVTTSEDTAKAITLVATDGENNPLIYTVVTGPMHGTLSGTAPNLTYTPNANYNGPDSFTFKANDGTADSNIATVSITVNAVNDAPTANAGTLATNEDTAQSRHWWPPMWIAPI